MLKVFTLIAFLLISNTSFANDNISYIVFYHGIGCPHCSRAGMKLDEFARTHSNVLIEKKEVYRNRENVLAMLEDCKKYGIISCNGVPLLITNTGQHVAGDLPIITFLETIK